MKKVGGKIAAPLMWCLISGLKSITRRLFMNAMQMIVRNECEMDPHKQES